VAEYNERPDLRDVSMEFFSGGLYTSAVVGFSGEVPELSSDNTRYYAVLGRECAGGEGNFAHSVPHCSTLLI
jgi:hypothetical protein